MSGLFDVKSALQHSIAGMVSNASFRRRLFNSHHAVEIFYFDIMLRMRKMLPKVKLALTVRLEELSKHAMLVSSVK